VEYYFDLHSHSSIK
jgi:hypothetical protein